MSKIKPAPPRGFGPLLFHHDVEKNEQKQILCGDTTQVLEQRGLGWEFQHPCALLQRQDPLIPPHRGGTPPKQDLGVFQPSPCPVELPGPCLW